MSYAAGDRIATGDALAAAVHRIWCEVLEIDDLDPQASLFDVGGHSLMATQIMARVRSELRVALTLDAFFDEPTSAGVAALVAQFHASGAAPAPAADAAPPQDPERSAPLSPAQERLWFLYRLDPADTAYNMPTTLRIRGALDTAALDRALRELVDRHPMLRATFGDRDGRPTQTIGDHGPDLERIDLSAAPDPEHARKLVAERADRPFDLERGPVFRVTLVRLAADDHVFGVVLHHIAGDGWSLEVLLREVSELYAAFVDGEPSPLKPLELTYLEHVRHSQSADAAALESWTTRLAGAPVLELPTDRPRRPIRSGRGERLVFELPADLVARLEALARAERSTLFMVLLAAYQVLLSRYSGQRDICVGTPVLGRADVRAEQVVGYFAGTVVLRGDLSADPPFRDFLRATRSSTLRAISGPEVPLERILAELRIDRDRSRTPLFQAMFMLLRQPEAKPHLGHLDAEIFDQGLSGAKTDIGLDIYQGPHSANAVLTYDTDLFDRPTITRMTTHYRTLLEDAATRPGARVSELRLMDAAERTEVLHRWNGDTGHDSEAAQISDADAVSGAEGEPTSAQSVARAEAPQQLNEGAGQDSATTQLRRTPGEGELTSAHLGAGAESLHRLNEGTGRDSAVAQPRRTPGEMIAAEAAQTPDADAVSGAEGQATSAHLVAGAAEQPRRTPGEAVDAQAAGIPNANAVSGAEGEATSVHLVAGAAAQPRRTPGEAIAAQAARTPDAVAVSGVDGDLTYAQLMVRADEIAALLGERRGLVAVSLRRSPDLVAALLAVWRLGAAYLPLDPEFPAERTALILADSGASVLLTERALAGRFGAHEIVVLEDAEAGARPVEVRSAGLEAPAYVLYTSGSTGRPKGVAVPHRALAAFLDAMTGLLGVQGGRSWLGLTSLSFDISALEIFLPLTGGGRLVLVPDGVARDGAALVALIERAGVTDVQATPSGWRLLLESGFAGGDIDVLVGGEALPPQLARDLRSRVRRLVNMYGPTETTIWSSWWEVPQDPDEVLIGGPIAGTQLYVLDEHLEPVPIGVPGELCVAGEGVAIGYLGRPGLTAEKFQPDPFGPPGSRLYHTGDRVRRRAGGAIEFLGRTDDQVKLRGHRIELGEIEAVLDSHPNVRGAAVVVRDELLVAYVVGDIGDADDLIAHAAAALPAAMVPALVVAIDALPLTPNGKIDRRALPAVRPEQPRARGSAPRTPAQRRVADVFTDVLGHGPLGVNDDFFALGGHSLLAAKAVARLDRLPIGDLFANPTVSGLAAVMERRQNSESASGQFGSQASEPQLSPAQQRLWFLHRLEPDSAAYNMYNVWRLRGPLDADDFRSALDDLVARHETLRTRYPDQDGVPIAVVEPPGIVDVERIDLSDASGSAEPHARRLVADRVNAPFDLTTAPPLRAALIRLADGDHVFCLVLHHIAGDGWSLNILRDDFAALYAARRAGQGSPFDQNYDTDLVRYADIDPAYWNRDRTADLEYWRAQLAEPTVLDLPTDHPRPALSRHSGGIHPFRVPAELTERLERLGRQHGATPFMVLLAAYQILLARHSGQDDILVGTPAAGRDAVELERVVGYFTRTLVLRGDLSGDPRFDDLLARTRTTVLDALGHQDVPFEELLSALAVDRDPSRTPLFQTMAILHSQDEDAVADRFADLALAPFDAGYRQAKFDLMLEAWRDDEGLSLLLDYDTELFDETTVAGLAERLVLVLTGIADDPNRPISALPMLTAADQRFLDKHASAAPDRGPLVPELIAATIRRAPEAVAVSCGTDVLTYAELGERADRLAAAIAGAETVGVCLPRSTDMIVALLAAWHAGAAYLPLDPEYPQQRRDLMTTDSGASVVLTDVDLTQSLTQNSETPQTARPEVRTAPAYIIYTSGSTGVPKGVTVTHANLAARVRWMVDEYELGADDVVVQFASLSFDTHAEEIYPALVAGAQVRLLPDGGASLPDFLAAAPDVTVLDLPTAHWHQLVDVIDDIAWPDALRLVILGGEQVHASAVARWREKFGDRVRLVNTYGPTETTIIATAADLTGGTDRRPPIGRPIAATSVQILDRAGQPVPPGAVGELVIGGSGVARGYLGRPELTAERFTPDPHGAPGARRYHSGDLARWRDDGQLEFLGRLDDQVKVRGFRVEPGEVEHRILSHPLVGGAAVIVRDDALVAFVVGLTGGTAAVSADALRVHLAETLPPHLIPGRIVTVERLPLTVSGKVDRAALAALAPELRDADADTGADADAHPDTSPLTDAEQLVAEVWSEVLGVEGLRAGDHFFHLGGHSLMAMRVAARIQAATDIRVPIRTLLAHPRLRDLAAAVEDIATAELAALTDEEADRLLASKEDS
ncbi:amino acid adenylation domain protein [Catenulispora acidiphila DSM 44928]|uniref:Amino acid adenylation domain protein n=1 Tax=Catenulispora acidiphila (strain DSM 44928 / JCM 14897 / NBRC 102108 / NRRL B-24433 / ID139908) TaxID=479433 RepID=C7Q4X7_CATAD|nr:non-ribosomal peptide synthetase [Catenulispora acidiphila]ACU73925.1 amino acid adenylation domain protein [Catenulispora acidiphila DSM 44928]